MTDTPNAADIQLPPIDQVGYVVRDLEASMARYEAVFGPFETMEQTLEGPLFRGQPHNCHLKLAFGKSGDMQIEFIEITDGREHLEVVSGNAANQMFTARSHISVLTAMGATLGFYP